MSVACIECKNANFQRTPSGRLKKGVGSRCAAEPKFPVLGCGKITCHKTYVWPDTVFERCDFFLKEEPK